jgi:6-pyruvoyltetrahydropterin/6-carboxytetrahydropterin synthase
MEIRKEFSFMGSHRVVNCSSDRCKYSIHGHLYIVELYLKSFQDLEGEFLDNGQMVYDFGLMKTTLRDFIKLFNDTYALWNKESGEFKTQIKKITKRWIELPCSPSAESLSLLILRVANEILAKTHTANGEKQLIV